MSIIESIMVPLQTFRRYFKQMAPLFWGVSILPYYMGWSLANSKIYPTPVQNMYMEMFVFFIGLISIGPLLGGATILYNDFLSCRHWGSWSGVTFFHSPFLPERARDSVCLYLL